MNSPVNSSQQTPNSAGNDETNFGVLDLNLETLDQWENELDDFSMSIRSRLGSLTEAAATAEQSKPSEQPTHDPANQQSIDILRSVQGLTK